MLVFDVVNGLGDWMTGENCKWRRWRAGELKKYRKGDLLVSECR